MKKIIAIMLAVLMLASMTACAGKPASETPAATETPAAAEAPAASEEAAETDKDYVVGKGKLVVGITDFAPMDYQENGEWIGFDADMAKAFAKSLGVEAEFVEIDWDNKILELDSTIIDCVWNGMTLTSEVTSSMETCLLYTSRCV